MSIKQDVRLKRKRRIRKKIYGTEEKPRLSVFRSAKHIYAQLIIDDKNHTIAAASSREKEFLENAELKGKIAKSQLVGKIIAQRAMDKGITKIVFDRNGFLYHGRIKAVSEGAREAGLKF